MNSLIMVTIGIVILIGVLFFVSITPKKTNDFSLSKINNLDPTLAKLVELFGGDISTFFPDKIENRNEISRIERLIEISNNPWNISAREFLVLKLVLSGIGIVSGLFLGSILSYVFADILELPLIASIVVVIAITFALGTLGYKYPETYYENAKSRRDKDFKKNLPEAIDYLTMILAGGGYSLPVAFEMSLEYLAPGAVKEEFSKVVSDLHTGKTMESALIDFGERAPSESIRAFTKALNNANKLSVSVTEILKNRAETSRKELELEIEKRLASLPVKIMMILSPSAALSIMIIALAPSADALMRML